MNTHNDASSEHRHKALRFLTAGSVDDGKSTLIGRLLLDSRAILADQLDALHRRAAGGSIDLSQLTDGLEAEREQGITIDVAYRYFTTPRRKFIIADAPGHEQYTRSMVTAAAGSDAAVVLIDITKLDWRAAPLRLLPQTRRHTLLARLLRLPSIVFAVNKLDTVDDAEAAFRAVRGALLHFAAEAGIAPAGIVPVSALRGDNIAIASPAWPWYAGPTLLDLLEALPAASDPVHGGLLLPVQYVARTGDGTRHQSRVVWGRIARGSARVGDRVRLLSSGVDAIIVDVLGVSSVSGARRAGESAGLVLDRQIDVSRGDWIVHAESAPRLTTSFSATVAWLDVEPAIIGRKVWLRHAHQWVAGRITAIEGCLDIHTLESAPAHALGANDIGRVHVVAQTGLPLVPYADNRVAGAMIIVDPVSHRTSGAVLVEAVR